MTVATEFPSREEILSLYFSVRPNFLGNTVAATEFPGDNISCDTGAKERPTAENLNRNFDLSAIDHIRQLENLHYCYIHLKVEVVHLCSFCSNCYVTVCQIRAGCCG